MVSKSSKIAMLLDKNARSLVLPPLQRKFKKGEKAMLHKKLVIAVKKESLLFNKYYKRRK